MRTRTQDNTTSSYVTGTGTEKLNNTGVSPMRCDTVSKSFTSNFPVVTGSKKSMTDVVIPNFHKRSAAGEIFINRMSSFSSKREIEFSSRAYHIPYAPSVPAPSRKCGYDYQLINEVSSPYALNVIGSQVGHLNVDIGVQNLINLAGTSASANIDSPTFDGAVFIGELRETIGYFRNPLSAFNKVVEDARHWKRRKRKLDHKTTAEYISDNWLSYRYSIRPIVNDVRNAAEAVARTVLDNEPLRKTARGTASETGQSYSAGSVGFVDYETTTSKTVTARAGVLYELSRSPNTFGVGTERLAIVGWELIPFSFVADWFFNVGTFIEAITPVAGVKRLGSWTTVATEETTTRSSWWERGGIAPNGQPRVINSNAATTERYASVTKNRTPGIQIGLGQKITPLAGDIGKARILDLIALGQQILRSK